ncbi:MAG: biphenyl 2,3-dioxygenase, partial [Acetobacteraceae bacterium]|nr:biphenyl 2,3-dioxygenase [Acetobacteraceae bacterium]
MAVQALGYVGIEARSPEDWAGYGTGFLGLQLAERSAGQLVFRMDDRKQRLVVMPGERDGARFFGWEVADAAALTAIAARL